jgi:hypothetical protein
MAATGMHRVGVDRAGEAWRGTAQRTMAAPALSLCWIRGVEGARVGWRWPLGRECFGLRMGKMKVERKLGRLPRMGCR